MSHDGHDHGHGGGAHHHHPKATSDNERRVLIVLALTGSYMVVEVIGGVISGSLALIADGGHMLTDTAALALSWFAFRMARKPSDGKRSYGYHRLQVVAAFVNGIVLVALTGWIVIEAGIRFFNPVPIEGDVMSGVAAVGLLVNIAGLWILNRGNQDNLNLRGASLHVLGDLLASIGAVGAGIVIMIWGWTPIDPILSILVSVLILRSATTLVRQSGHILMEGSPRDHDAERIEKVLEERVDDVEDIHHVHVWQLTEERPLVTLHATVIWNADRDRVLRDIKQVLAAEFGLDHATVQIEAGECPDADHDYPAHDHG
jgi:cobalt-zinc-cadmium efflux system protein